MDVEIVVVPYDSGALDVRMGAGPGRLLELGLEERITAGGHTVHVSTLVAPEGPLEAEVATAFALNRLLSTAVSDARQDGRFPVVLTGNCISALGTVAGLEGRTGVLWFDTHGDFNTPGTTTGGFLDGMALAALTGRCWQGLVAQIPGFVPVADEDTVLVGTRDLDPPEADLLATSGVRILAPDEAPDGLGPVADDLADRVESVYVHLDLDVMDPRDGIANQFAMPDGLRLETLEGVIADVAARLRVGAVTLSAYDPAADHDGRAGEAALKLLVRLVAEVARWRAG